MDLLAAYASDEESGSPASAVAEAPVIIPAKVVDAAPVVTYNPSTAIMPFGMPMVRDLLVPTFLWCFCMNSKCIIFLILLCYLFD